MAGLALLAHVELRVQHVQPPLRELQCLSLLLVRRRELHELRVLRSDRVLRLEASTPLGLELDMHGRDAGAALLLEHEQTVALSADDAFEVCPPIAFALCRIGDRADQRAVQYAGGSLGL